jgi:hypothetical protein
VVQALLGAGCNKDLQDRGGRVQVGWSAMHEAASEGHLDVLKALISAGMTYLMTYLHTHTCVRHTHV